MYWMIHVKSIPCEQAIDQLCRDYQVEPIVVIEWYDHYARNGEFSSLLSLHIDANGMQKLNAWFVEDCNAKDIHCFDKIVMKLVRQTAKRKRGFNKK